MSYTIPNILSIHYRHIIYHSWSKQTKYLIIYSQQISKLVETPTIPKATERDQVEHFGTVLKIRLDGLVITVQAIIIYVFHPAKWVLQDRLLPLAPDWSHC